MKASNVLTLENSSNFSPTGVDLHMEMGHWLIFSSFFSPFETIGVSEIHACAYMVFCWEYLTLAFSGLGYVKSSS